MTTTPDRMRNAWLTLPAILLIASMATLVQAFIAVKLFFLGLFLVTALVRVLQRGRLVVYPRLVRFYLVLSVAGIVWAIVGLFHAGNYELGVFDALRLYVMWSLAFLVLFTLLRAEWPLGVIHRSMVLAGILISLINFVALFDQVSGLGVIPQGVREELQLFVGIHEGYIRINSNNIGALFLIVPYLLALQFRADARKANSAVTRLSLGLCLILAAVSGRRALWLVVAMTPCIILLVAIVTNSLELIRPGGRRMLFTYSMAGLLVLGTTSVLPARIQEAGYVRHLMDAFSAQDERTIQKGYLIDAFAESPVLGSGFGAYAGYLRSEDRPWTYELTYHQMLFNVGLVGFAVLAGLFLVYLVLVLKLLRQYKQELAIPFGLMIGFCALLIGAYSNPYLRSFDYLFFVGLLPYLSTFEAGFNSPALPLRGCSAPGRWAHDEPPASAARVQT